MSEEFTAADHEAAGEAWEQAGIDRDDSPTEVYYWGFKAGCLYGRRTPGPTTSSESLVISSTATCGFATVDKVTINGVEYVPVVPCPRKPEDANQ